MTRKLKPRNETDEAGVAGRGSFARPIAEFGVGVYEHVVRQKRWPWLRAKNRGDTAYAGHRGPGHAVSDATHTRRSDATSRRNVSLWGLLTQEETAGHIARAHTSVRSGAPSRPASSRSADSGRGP